MDGVPYSRVRRTLRVYFVRSRYIVQNQGRMYPIRARRLPVAVRYSRSSPRALRSTCEDNRSSG
jgi:hypothetical protein